jgi:tetratricopeptide (TPR) repeat protein
LKTKDLKYFSFFLFFLLLLACSTKKDKFINRKFQALNTKFNVLYHGNVALTKGVIEVKTQNKDNFWEILPVERMQVSAENILPGQSKNANFERAELKATKAIQKRSMNIEGKEKNSQIDEAYLLLGKSRYYDQRFIPALEAFNYILYKYPESDKIFEAKIWREKTNMRLENDALAVKNLRKLLKDIKVKDQIFADANATLTQAFLNLGQKDSAMICLKAATTFTKINEEKSRYRFILGQLYNELGFKDSAFVAFQSVIDMKRKSARSYVIQSHGKQTQVFDPKKGDTLLFNEKYKKLLADRENRPFLDVLNHQLGLYYDRNKNNKKAVIYYNKSLRTKSTDQYLVASNYRNLAKINFDNAKYQTAGQYYDSTLVNLTVKTKEYNAIKKKRENLADVIKYEAIAQRNDSVLNVLSLSADDQKGFYEDYIAKIKKADKEKAALEKEKADKAARIAGNSNAEDDPIVGKSISSSRSDASGIAPPSFGPKATSDDANTFYFYNPSTVAYGKLEFKKKWGDRSLKGNWRLFSEQAKLSPNDVVTEKETTDAKEEDSKEKSVEPKYTVDFYLKQLPTTQKVIDSLAKERNFAYYQLGVIYKEKFKEYKLASSKLEQLLKNNPEERLILPAMYNLFKIYEITDKEMALVMKNKIIAQYPNSRYAQILSNGNLNQSSLNESPDVAYQKLYKRYLDGDYYKVLDQVTKYIDQFTGEEIAPKFELLKAHTVGKLKGLTEYKTALNFVALNYPNVEEGKNAEQLLATNIPVFEKMKFYATKPASWKIIYKVRNIDSLKTKSLIDIVTKFAAERTIDILKSSMDIYSMTESFVVIHGFKTEEKANNVATILRDYKDYNIADIAVVISNENYKIVQIKKNLADYLVTPKTAPLPEQPAAPQPTNPNSNPANPNKTQNKVISPPPGMNIIDGDDPPPTNESSPEREVPTMPKKP